MYINTVSSYDIMKPFAIAAKILAAPAVVGSSTFMNCSGAMHRHAYLLIIAKQQTIKTLDFHSLKLKYKLVGGVVLDRWPYYLLFDISIKTYQ